MIDKDPNERSWLLATKALQGELTAGEEKEWHTLLEKDAAFHDDFERVKAYWEKAGHLPYGRIDIDKDWGKVAARIKKRNNFFPLMKYAAAVAVLAVAAFLLLRRGGMLFSPAAEALTTIEAPAGSQTHVTLPDSSAVWLNAGSKISFNRAFGSSNRKLTLEGEAFFDVTKSKVPFRVFTAGYDIKVLGTAFNIRAYADDPTLVTTLVRGSLRVNNIHTSDGLKAALLKPGDRLTLHKSNDLSQQTVNLEGNVDINLETAWKDGWLTVKSETLDEFAKKLERLYDIDIRFEAEELKTYRYTGKIKQLSLEQVLKALALTSPIAFDISEKTVTMRVNENTRSKYRDLQKP